MNSVNITGRITKDPEILHTNNGNDFMLFTLAIDRGYKDADGNKLTDFIPCVAWNNQANFINKYVKKGNLLEVTGTIQSRTYQTKNGENRTVIEVVLDNVSNLTPKPKEEIPAPQEPSRYNQKTTQQEENSKQIDDEDLPF